MSIRPWLLLAAAAAIACAPPAARGERRDSNFMDRDEIAASQATNAYDAINHARPAWLRSRGRNTFGTVVSEYAEVFLDGQRFGEIQILRTMTLDQISHIRFMNASDATTRFGTGHTAGVIEVVTRQQ